MDVSRSKNSSGSRRQAMEIDDLDSSKRTHLPYQGLSTENIILHVFASQENNTWHQEFGSSMYKVINLHNLADYITKKLDDTVRHFNPPSDNDSRLGHKKVMFDVNTNVGSFVIDKDRLGVSSQNNFSTIRANVCVFKGKWIYEVMLGSKGVMQLGWSTRKCEFSQERGVGDTANSYAYDGNRMRKWNMATSKYGESWLRGDIVSCAINLDDGIIDFYRNGKYLGKAFDDVSVGPGYAYFPAVSLAYTENIRVNFGTSPLRYPVEGYRPLQDPPYEDLAKATLLMSWFGHLLPLIVLVDKEEQDNLAGLMSSVHTCRSRKATLTLIAAHIFEHLGPFLTQQYIVEACLLPFILSICDTSSCRVEQPYIQTTLDLIWMLFEDHEVKACLENLIIVLLSVYRFSPATPEFNFQKINLILTLAIIKHESTRRFLLKNVLFDKIKFPIFMHIKPPDDAGLQEVIPIVWWKNNKQNKDELESELDLQQRLQYEAACEDLHQKVLELEEIQIEMLKVLLQNGPHSKGSSTRSLFLEKFREFLKENSAGSRLHPVHMCPPPVILCFFHRLIQALRFYWDLYSNCYVGIVVPSSEAFIPCKVFYDDSVNYFEIQRLGGLLSYLKKTMKDEVAKALGHEPSIQTEHQDSMNVSSSFVNGLATVSLCNSSSFSETQDGAPCSLVELLDGIIMLYHIAAHKLLAKMCTLRDNMLEYTNALYDTQQKIFRCPLESNDIQEELQRSEAVLRDKICEQARQMAWVVAVIYSKEKQEDVYWLLNALLSTLNEASKHNNLFSFVPDFYVESCINTSNALRTYFSPTISPQELPGYTDTLVKYAMFLSSHFSDKRIINADTKDALIQALASSVSHPATLNALESMPVECRRTMIKALMAPYENRAWAQSNWILVRLWKGCGFGFRYTQLPHLVKHMGPKAQQAETNTNNLQKPCPSPLFQSHVAELLLGDIERASAFLNSVLNQLNWAFSEFIGMLQEIQNVSTRPESVYIDSRQLKICATCFDLAVGLLRVLEMVIHVAPELFTDWTKTSAELLLARLYQLICQVLNRVTSRSGCFGHVVSLEMPGLDSVDHYPIITAVAGILTELITRGTPQSIECATVALLVEPSFQITSIEFLLGSPPGAAAMPLHNKYFSLHKYPDVTSEEIERVEKLYHDLVLQQNKLASSAQATSEEDLCTICYAHPISAVFYPCGHTSCRGCIIHHLMNKKECFFCKAEVTLVRDLNGKLVQDLTKKSTSV